MAGSSPAPLHHYLLQELAEEEEERRRDFDRRRPVEQRDAAAGGERPDLPERQEVLLEREAAGEGAERERDERLRAAALEDVDGGGRGQPPVGAVLGGEVDEQ